MKSKSFLIIVTAAIALSMQACNQTVSGDPDRSVSDTASLSSSTAFTSSEALKNGIIAKEKNYEIDRDENDNLYRYSIWDNSNGVLDSQDSLKAQPEIFPVGQDILRIWTHDGTNADSCRYYNVSNSIASEWFPVKPLAETDRVFAYIDKLKSRLIVQEIFNPSANCKMFPVEMTGTSADNFTARFLDGGGKIEVIRTDDGGNRKVYTFVLS